MPAATAAGGAAAAARGALAAYRELLRLLRRLPEPQRAPSAASARAELRRGAALTGEAASEAVARLESRVAYLRMATPRAPGGGGGGGGGTYVLRDGRLVEGRGRSAGARAGAEGPSADEAVRRHAQLVRRQHFGRAPPPYNPRSF